MGMSYNGECFVGTRIWGKMTQRGTRFVGGGIENTDFAHFWMDKVEQAPSFYDNRHVCKRTVKRKKEEGTPHSTHPLPLGLPSNHSFSFSFFLSLISETLHALMHCIFPFELWLPSLSLSLSFFPSLSLVLSPLGSSLILYPTSECLFWTPFNSTTNLFPAMFILVYSIKLFNCILLHDFSYDSFLSYFNSFLFKIEKFDT